MGMGVYLFPPAESRDETRHRWMMDGAQDADLTADRRGIPHFLHGGLADDLDGVLRPTAPRRALVSTLAKPNYNYYL